MLAAGGSRRFGTPKGLARFKDRTLLDLAVERVLQVSGDQHLIVLGADADALLAEVSLDPNRTRRVEDWREGHAASLRCGLAAIPRESPAVLVTLLDQPLIEASDLRQLVAAWSAHPGRAAAAHYGGLLGAPCIFPRSWFPALSRLEGDRGAAALLREAADAIRVSMPNAAYDVDTPADLEQLHALTRTSRTQRTSLS